jgi:hypothetical protein
VDVKGTVIGLMMLAAGLGAAVPEGKGSLDLGLRLGQGEVAESGSWGYYNVGTAYGLSLGGDLPIWSGIALGLGLGGSNTPYSMTEFGFAPKGAENIALYTFGADLRLYPAAFLGKPFIPGGNANPDGWLLWPSVALQYGYAKSEDYNYGWFTAPINTMTNTFTTTQDLGYKLVLPLTPLLSMRAAYLRNTQEDLDYTEVYGPNAKLQSGGAYEEEGLGVSGFIDLAHGAGSDLERAFVPHFGRVGQLRVDLDWARRLQLPWALDPLARATQTYGLTVGAPLTSSLGLSLSVAQSESDAQLGGYSWRFVKGFGPTLSNSTENRDTWQYGLNLSWAFGSAESRTDK